MKTTSNEAAFPVAVSETTSEVSPGLTKREYFAAMALQGMLVNGFQPNQANQLGNAADFNYAKAAVKMADKLWEALYP